MAEHFLSSCDAEISVLCPDVEETSLDGPISRPHSLA